MEAIVILLAAFVLAIGLDEEPAQTPEQGA
jgi:hypothetical protein